MNTSESIKEISSALVKFHASVGKIKKGSNNPFFKSKYASLSDILDIIDEPLTSNGLVIVQFPEGTNTLTTRLLHESGEWIEANYFMKPTKEDPQSFGSVITYQRRYAIGAILSLNIGTEEDDDGNKASEPVKKPKLTPEHPGWNKAAEYVASNGITAVLLSKYDISEADKKTLESHALELHEQIKKQKEA